MAPKKKGGAKGGKKGKVGKPDWMSAELYDLTLNLAKLQEFWCGEVKETKGKGKDGQPLPDPPNISKDQVSTLPGRSRHSRIHPALTCTLDTSQLMFLLAYACRSWVCSSQGCIHGPPTKPQAVISCMPLACTGRAVHVGAPLCQRQGLKRAQGGVHQAGRGRDVHQGAGCWQA